MTPPITLERAEGFDVGRNFHGGRFGGNDTYRTLESPRFVGMLTYDRLDLTQKAINSVFEQSSEDVRLVVLDNGSRDGTLEYLADLQSSHPGRVDFLKSNTNLGVAGGRNRIFKHIMGKHGDNFQWVLSLDNDCILHRGYDSAITKCMEETGALSVCPNLIQPDGSVLYDANNGFMINLRDKKLKLQYTEGGPVMPGDPRVSRRQETDVILGTSAKAPGFFRKVGFYDEGHQIGWEDFSLALKAFGLTKDNFESWMAQQNDGEKWIPLRNLVNGHAKNKAKVVFEPQCKITHDHPMTPRYQSYEAIRRNEETIRKSTDRFEDVWGVRPVSRRSKD